MTWKITDLPLNIQNKPSHILQEGIAAANTAISKGLSNEEATFVCLQKIKSLESRLKPSKAPSRVVPEHVKQLLKAKLQEPEVKQGIQREFLGKNALPTNTERNLVNAEFNKSDQLVLTFDTGETIITKSVAIKEYIEQHLSIQAGLSNPVNYIEFNQTAEIVAETAQLTWNAVDGTLDLGLLGGNVTLQIGQEQIVRFVNHTDMDFAEMQVVRIIGAQGNRLSAALAQSNTEVNSNTTFAVVTEPILKNQQGYATVSGLVRDLDTSAFPEGAVLYLSPTTPGGITSTIPVSPNRNVRVGYCVRSHATVGSIFVNIINDPELKELPDVLMVSPQNNDVLTYDSTDSLWKNKSLTSSVLSTRLISTDYTVVSSDYTIRVDCSVSPVVVSLPSVINSTGRIVVIKKIDSSGNPVQIKANSVELIDGVNAAEIYVQHLALSLQSNGSSWDII